MCEFQIVDDGGQEEAEGVETAQDGEVRERRQPDLHVEDAALDLVPGEVLVDLGRLLEAVACAGFLGRGEEACGFDVVGQEEVGDAADEECDESFLEYC